MYCSVEEEPKNAIIASNSSCLLRVRSGIFITVICTSALVRDDRTVHHYLKSHPRLRIFPPEIVSTNLGLASLVSRVINRWALI